MTVYFSGHDHDEEPVNTFRSFSMVMAACVVSPTGTNCLNAGNSAEILKRFASVEGFNLAVQKGTKRIWGLKLVPMSALKP